MVIATPARAAAVLPAADPQRTAGVSRAQSFPGCRHKWFRAARGDPGPLSLSGESLAKSRRDTALVFQDAEMEGVTPNQTYSLELGEGFAEGRASRITSEPSSVCRMEAFSKARVRAKPPISFQPTSSSGRREDFCI